MDFFLSLETGKRVSVFSLSLGQQGFCRKSLSFPCRENKGPYMFPEHCKHSSAFSSSWGSRSPFLPLGWSPCKSSHVRVRSFSHRLLCKWEKASTELDTKFPQEPGGSVHVYTSQTSPEGQRCSWFTKILAGNAVSFIKLQWVWNVFLMSGDGLGPELRTPGPRQSCAVHLPQAGQAP